MDKYNSSESTQVEEEKTCQNGSNIFKPFTHTANTVLKKLVAFICYGPGVLGFLWLIGRILKR